MKLLGNEKIKSLLQAILLALLIRTLLFQPSSIPSGSMIPNLLVGDYIIINKFSYGYSKYSIPFSYDLFKGRIFGSQPKRGDIVVFRLPRDPRNTDYVKRLIGLPGDKISVKRGVVYINDVPVPQNPEGVFNHQYHEADWSNDSVSIFREKLSNGITYRVLYNNPLSSSNNTLDFFIPPGQYFMMGDNRENSVDSRFTEVGFVPEENLIGRASIVLFSTIRSDSPNKIWGFIPHMRWNRFFKIL